MAIWAVGFGSLLMDTSSELVHSLSPVLLVNVLGASAVAVGMIQGVAEGIAAVTKVFAGALSDYFVDAKRSSCSVIRSLRFLGRSFHSRVLRLGFSARGLSIG